MKALTISGAMEISAELVSFESQKLKPSMFESGASSGVAAQVTEVLHQHESRIELSADELQVIHNFPERGGTRFCSAVESRPQSITLKLHYRAARVGVQLRPHTARWLSCVDRSELRAIDEFRSEPLLVSRQLGFPHALPNYKDFTAMKSLS